MRHMGNGSRYPGVERYQGPEGIRWIARASKRLPSGKRVHWEKVYSREADANRARREWLTQHDTGTAADPGKASVADALNTWLESHGPGLAASTRKGYADTLRVHLLPSPIAHVPLWKLTAEQIQGWYNGLEVGARTGELIHLRLCQALELAVKQRRLGHNHARDCEVPRAVPRRGTALSDAEVARFLDHAREDVYHPLWHLALGTGLRRAELLGLRWQDVDLGRGILLVRQTGVWVAGRITLQLRTKTPSSRRPVALDEGIVALLAEHKVRQSRAREKAGERWREHDLVIPSDVGTPVGAPNMHRNYKRLLERADLPDSVRINDMRHTHHSALLNAGVPVTTVAERGGYRNANVLLSVYAHAQTEGQRAAAAVAGKLIGGGGKGGAETSGGELAGK